MKVLIPILSLTLNFKIGVDEPSFLLDDWLWGESFMDDIGTTDLPQWVQNLYEVAFVICSTVWVDGVA